MNQRKSVKKTAKALASQHSSGLKKPGSNLAPRDAKRITEELEDYHKNYVDLYKRQEQCEWAEFYLKGQLSDLERKTVEPMVLVMKGRDMAAVRAVQQFLSEGAWEDAALLNRREKMVAEDIGEDEGVLICGKGSFLKKGEHSVGVAPQNCCLLGKTANCQQGVFLIYSGSRGYTFIDRRLYMPEIWFSDEYARKRERCGVPQKLRFKVEPELAEEMIRAIVQRDQLSFQWVNAGKNFGINDDFLDGIDALGKWYIVEVPNNLVVWQADVKINTLRTSTIGGQERLQAQEVRQIGATLLAKAWKKYAIKGDRNEQIVAEFAFIRATSKRDHHQGHSVWIVFRRDLNPNGESKYYLSNAPINCPRATLARVSGLYWQLQGALEESKSELGMDHYETRTWRGWHHQMTMSFLAHHFLLRLRLRSEGKPSR